MSGSGLVHRPRQPDETLTEFEARINRAAEEQRAHEAESREADRDYAAELGRKDRPGALGALDRTLGDLPGHPVSLVGPHADAYARFQRACVGLRESRRAYEAASQEYRDALEVFSKLTDDAAAKR